MIARAGVASVAELDRVAERSRRKLQAREYSVRVGLLNVKFSPNLGDGLLAECMEKELAARGGVSKVVSIDLVGRLAYGQGGVRNRETAIRVLGLG